MLIVLEGPDGAGKSTLASQLTAAAAEHGKSVQIIHKGPPTHHPLVEYEHDLEWYRPSMDNLIVLDRWHVGEMVYGPILRGASRLSPEGFTHIELFLDSIGALRIWLDPGIDVLHERVQRDGDWLITVDQLAAISNGYHEILDDNTLWMHQEHPDVELALEFARIHTRNAQKLAAFTTYIGPPSPDILLLGERHGDARAGRPRYRGAFVPYPDTSGAYLLNALHLTKTTLRFGIANALQENVSALWETLGRPDTVALGRKAAVCLKHTGIKYGHVPHPQFARRFRHSACEAYGQAILTAAAKGQPVWLR